MIEVETLAEGTFSDAIITNLWGSDYCFTTCSSTPEEETSIQYIYRIDRQNLIFQLFPKIRFKDKTARNAGDFFKIGNRIYRPAQDCRKIMVEALLFMKCFNILMVNLVLKKFVD